MQIIYEDENHIMPDSTIWHLTVYDQMVTDLDGQLVNAHSMVRVPTPEEREAQVLAEEKRSRIEELKDIISNKKILDMDCSLEQVELKALLEL